jgi:hypothetical protein
LLRAWASLSSLGRIDRPDADPPTPSGGNGVGFAPAKRKKSAKGDFRCLLLFNQTHRSCSDGAGRLFRRSNSVGVDLSYLGHGLMAHRRGLAVASEVNPAVGHGARAAALQMVRSLAGSQQKTSGDGKGHDKRTTSLVCASQA